MSHDDICPCKHDTYVCLLPCPECSPDAFVPDDVWADHARAAYHAIDVENERLSKENLRLRAAFMAVYDEAVRVARFRLRDECQPKEEQP